MIRLLSVLFLGLFMVCLAGSAFADKPLSKAAKEKAAKKACATGNFAKGVDILADLFVDTNDFSYVYNQGRCYQQNNRFEQAISRFREYLRKAKDISESDRAETERQIADCEASLPKTAQLAPPPAASTPPAPARHIETLLPASEPTTPEVSNKSAPPTSDGSRGKGLRVSGIVLAAVGVAAIGTGVGLAVKSQSLSTKDYSRSREDERGFISRSGDGQGGGVAAAPVAVKALRASSASLRPYG